MRRKCISIHLDSSQSGIAHNTLAFGPPETTRVQDHDTESNYKKEILSCLLIINIGKANRITFFSFAAIQLQPGFLKSTAFSEV